MRKLSPLVAFVIWLGGVALLAGLLYYNGRSPICACGTVKFFDVGGFAGEDSQHIFDWYSFSHILHGLIFYFFIWLIGRGRVSLAAGLLIATAIEGAWELFENSAYIIQKYKDTAVTASYNGDSIINSVADLLVMVAGFFLAAWLPVWASILLLVGIEVWMAWLIRDNLTTNIINLTYPIEWVTKWQEGGKQP